MKNLTLQFFAIFLFCSPIICAQEKKQSVGKFPNISGNILFQTQVDRIASSNKSGISANNAFIYIEPNISLNFNKNWSIKTDWRIQPNNVLTTRNSTYPERYRTFLSQNRGLGLQDTGLLVEELKLQFENDDMKFSVGKFDPTFGTAYNKAKRIGVFTSQFTEDYNLREKIGASLTAVLESNKITINTFFNDTTGLSQSVLNNRTRANRNDGVAGNTGTLSSYSIALDGENFFGVDDWFYNAGYRSLGVDNISGRKREEGYVFGSEYSYKVGYQTSIVPFFEISKINNFTGERNRNALYTTTALIGKYNSWTTSISHLTRYITQSQGITPKVNDRQLQFSVGYKFTNNITLDVSRSSLKEDGHSAALLGFVVGYLYRF